MPCLQYSGKDFCGLVTGFRSARKSPRHDESFSTAASGEADIQRAVAYIAEQTEASRTYHHGIQHPKDKPAPDPALEGLASYCQVLLSSNRFLYIE